MNMMMTMGDENNNDDYHEEEYDDDEDVDTITTVQMKMIMAMTASVSQTVWVILSRLRISIFADLPSCNFFQNLFCCLFRLSKGTSPTNSRIKPPPPSKELIPYERPLQIYCSEN